MLWPDLAAPLAAAAVEVGATAGDRPAWFGPAGIVAGVLLTVLGAVGLRRARRVPDTRRPGSARAPAWLLPGVLVVVGPLLTLFWAALTQV